MIHIDFLPEKYREQYHVRVQRTWRAVVIVLFVGIVASSAWLQSWMRRDAQEQLDAITATHVESVKINQQLSELFQELDQRKHQAELLTYLRHRWPATQLLRASLMPLEDSIALKSWSLYRQAESTGAVRRPSLSAPRNEEQDKAEKPPAIQDLERLRAVFDPMRTMIDIDGTTSDVNALHRYVGKLSLSDLFEEVSLVRLESQDPNSRGERMQFQIRVRVKRGPGQADPDPKANEKLAVRTQR